MGDELYAYRIEPKRNGFQLVLLVHSPTEPKKEYRVFLARDTALDLAKTLRDTLRSPD